MEFSSTGVHLNLPQGSIMLRVNTSLQWLHVCNISAGLNKLEKGLAEGKGLETINSMGPRFINELERAFVRADFDLLYAHIYDQQVSSQTTSNQGGAI